MCCCLTRLVIGLVASFLVCALLADTATANVTLPSIIGDHMVLQQDMPIPIWGWAAPGESVTVKLADSEVKAVADKEGAWSVRLPAMKAGGPHEMTITGADKITLADILVGEVWLGSGQSNMQMGVGGARDAEKEIAAANIPQIRLFHVMQTASAQPARTVKAEWLVCSPKTVGWFSAVAYYFGREIHNSLKVPVGLINSSWGGTRIEPWTTPAGFASESALMSFTDALKKNPPQASHGQATAIYNGMIHPLVPFAMRGALWYQGESNITDGAVYRTKMAALVKGWREAWGEGEFPFYFVQLAPWTYSNEAMLPVIWEAQSAALSIPNTGMVVTNDIGNLSDIHPVNKQEVGKRLALWALAKTYGKKDLVYSGPIYKSMAVEGDKIRISFDHAGSGLAARGEPTLRWFAIAGADKVFKKAQAKIDGDTVVVWNKTIAAPVAVRFAWHQLAEPNLMNKEGLPASSFRTDQWETKTTMMPPEMVGDSPEWAWAKVAPALKLPGIVLAEDTTAFVLDRPVDNASACNMEVRYKWDVAGTSWSIKPANGTLALPAGKKATFHADAKFDPKRVVPLPRMLSEVTISGVKMDPVVVPLQPIILRKADVAAVKKVPVIDGVISDGEYGDARSLDGFIEYRGTGMASQQTHFMLAHDDKALYVAVIADEPDAKGIVPNAHDRDGAVWQDDSIEIFVDSAFDKKTYHQFAVNSAGTQSDAIGGPGHGNWGDIKWNAKWDAAAKIGDNRYTVEVAIPFESLGVKPPKAGDTWGINICRSRQIAGKDIKAPELSEWSFTYANFHMPTNFGQVTFK